MALQHEYRPDSLESFFGNDTTIEAVGVTMRREEPPKAYLITGPEGSGKQELALRLIGLANGSIASKLEAVRDPHVHLIRPESRSPSRAGRRR